MLKSNSLSLSMEQNWIQREKKRKINLKSHSFLYKWLESIFIFNFELPKLCFKLSSSLSVCLVWMKFVNLFYYSAYFCYYSWVPLHFLVLFMSHTVLFQLTFTFIYRWLCSLGLFSKNSISFCAFTLQLLFFIIIIYYYYYYFAELLFTCFTVKSLHSDIGVDKCLCLDIVYLLKTENLLLKTL